MEARIIEGTFAEVQQQLSALPLAPEAPLRIVVTEPEEQPAPEEILFENRQRRSGLVRVPTKALNVANAVTMTDELTDRLDRLNAISGRIVGADVPAEALRRENLYEERT